MTTREANVAKRRRGRDVSGILVVDKPQGWSSNDAVQKAKRLFNARKVGHTGALDPLATGVLPLCFGEATKFSQYLLTSDKKYWTRLKLGIATDSGDADGNVVDTRPVQDVTAERVEAALRFFRGEIDQVPSMFSAVKHQGQPLYKLARQGIEIERAARRVKIFSNELVALEGD
jgi:tRNA pseudouridine55 synthase